MTWGADTASTQLTSVSDTEQFFTQTPQLNPGEQAHVEVEANPPSTPTDELIVSVYGTLDDSTESWDEVPILTFRIANTPDPNKASFIVSGVFKFRVGVASSGSTDVWTVDMNHRVDGVSL